MKHTVLFAPETFNLAETTRAIEVAKKSREDFECIFIGYSEKFSYLIRQAGFQFILLQPILTEKEVTQIMNVDQMKGIRHPFNYVYLKKRVEAERAIIAKLKPKAIVIGTMVSMFITARSKRVPLIYVKPIAYSRPYITEGKVGLYSSNTNVSWIVRRINKLLSSIMLRITYKPRAFIKVAKAYGVVLPKYTIDALDGDVNLITTIPELSKVYNLPYNYEYIGPVYAKLEVDIPEKITNVPRNKPVIYLAMGSSGSRKVIVKLLHVLEELPVTVICPMKKMLGQSVENFNTSSNIILCDLIPAHKIGHIIDLSIIHGGEGTVQTACLSGKPFIGFSFQMEQKNNINSAVLFGNGISIKSKDLTKKRMSELIQFCLSSDYLKYKAQQMKELIENIDGAENAAQYIKLHFK